MYVHKRCSQAPYSDAYRLLLLIFLIYCNKHLDAIGSSKSSFYGLDELPIECRFALLTLNEVKYKMCSIMEYRGHRFVFDSDFSSAHSSCSVSKRSSTVCCTKTKKHFLGLKPYKLMSVVTVPFRHLNMC